MSEHAETHTHDDHGHHHHKETFVTKYIFSQDHKMIAKQYLIMAEKTSWISQVTSVLLRVKTYLP